jgi:uncharacterized protein YoxC
METFTVLLAAAANFLCLFLFIALNRLDRTVNEERDLNDRRDENCRKAHMEAARCMDAANSLIAKLAENAAALSNRTNELERRLHCVEEDLEKIPVEEVKAETERLERFNDGIASIMSYGPDVPRLNKDAVTK